MSRSCQSGDVLEPDRGGGAHDSREPADPLGDDRVPLVRHRRRAFLAGAERLLHLAHLRAREVADLEREPLERRSDERERREQLRMPVARDDLRRDRLRLEAQPLAGDPLQLRVGRGIVPDRAGQLADAHTVQRPAQPLAVAVELERPAGELQPECRRFGVDAVRPPDAERRAMLLGASDDDRERALEALAQQGPGVVHLQGEAGVDDVRRREPVVNPAPLLAELRLDGVDERGQVVAGRPLALGDVAQARARCARSRTVRASSAGTTPSSAQASSAASSTSSQVSSFLSSDHTRAIAGRE